MPSINIATFTRVIRIGGDKWHDRLVDKKDSFFFFSFAVTMMKNL